MTQTITQRWIWWRIFLPPGLHLMSDLLGLLIYPDQVAAHYAGHVWYMLYFKEFIVITAGLYVLSEGNMRVYQILESKLPWEKYPVKRLIYQLVFAALWMLISAGGLAVVLSATGSVELGRESTINMMLMSLLVTIGVVLIFIFQKAKSSILEAERLRHQTSIAQDLALRQQTDPHFLFNSLNALTNLIMEDSNLAVQYVDRLSKVYRYVLQSKERKIVPLQEEIEFVRDFAFGFSIRFGENFALTIDVPDAVLETAIPPLTLQILVENCVKHNIVSREKPLSVRIYSGDSKIIVENPIQRKMPDTEPTQIGLKNIISRYALMTDKIVEIDETQGLFRVKLPLLPGEEE